MTRPDIVPGCPTRVGEWVHRGSPTVVTRGKGLIVLGRNRQPTRTYTMKKFGRRSRRLLSFGRLGLRETSRGVSRQRVTHVGLESLQMSRHKRMASVSSLREFLKPISFRSSKKIKTSTESLPPFYWVSQYEF